MGINMSIVMDAATGVYALASRRAPHFSMMKKVTTKNVTQVKMGSRKRERW